MSSTLHPDGKLNPHNSIANDSGNANILDLIEQRQLSRRGFLKSSLGVTAGATAVAVLGSNIVDGLTNYANAAPTPLNGIGFTPVPANTVPMIDAVTVPPGYTAKVLVSWGDSLTNAPHWDTVSAMDEATQLRCFGSHIDGMHLFPFPGNLANNRGLLVANHEYTDPGLVHSTFTYGSDVLTSAMVNTQLAAHGVGIVEIQKTNGTFQVKRPSAFNRRITGKTPCKISGPAAGHVMMQTAADPTGMTVLGTLNNCAHGYTPWGTYLTCEENFNGYFGSKTPLVQTNHEKRYGVTANGFGYRWHTADDRFDVNLNRNEANRFGWVVEIDPWNPNSTPVKRTAMGRFKHESAQLVVDSNDRVAFYQGDDERNEYVYKFVCANKLNRRNRAANRDMLDHGTLYVAKFNADGTGTWLPLVYGQNGLTAENGFNSQAEVVMMARQAADRLGATMMDRPEWAAAHPTTGEVYLTLTNNNRRGTNTPSTNNINGSSAAGSARPPVDAANPRNDNLYGHIIRWRETGGVVTATTFQWDIFAQCGDKLDADTNHQGNINGDDYGAPDGLWFDQDGRLWIQTDQQGDALGDWANIGGNVMMCADPSNGLTKRFLTSPKNCEVTGVINTPDGKTMFIGIQHPGEDWGGTGSFTGVSTWPDSGINGPTTFTGSSPAKPRSSVVVITKDDGGVIGS